MNTISRSLIAAALSAAALCAGGSALAQDEASDVAWVTATAEDALKQCPPATLSANDAKAAAEAAGWPKFKSKKIGNQPSEMSIKQLRPGERAGPQVALVFQTTGVSPVRALRCVVQATPAIGTALKDKLTARYGPQGAGDTGWWMKETAAGRAPLSQEESITILDGPKMLLMKLKSEDHIVFAFEETTAVVSVVTIETFANP